MIERPRNRPDLEDRSVDGEMVILDPVGDRIHQLNETASFIWTRCDGEHQLDQIARELAVAYGIEPDRTENDVRSTVSQFENLGLLASVESPAASRGVR